VKKEYQEEGNDKQVSQGLRRLPPAIQKFLGEKGGKEAKTNKKCLHG